MIRKFIDLLYGRISSSKKRHNVLAVISCVQTLLSPRDVIMMFGRIAMPGELAYRDFTFAISQMRLEYVNLRWQAWSAVNSFFDDSNANLPQFT